MTTSAALVIMSHLSDAQAGVNVNLHINFAKFLLLKYPNTSQEIAADEEWKMFETKFCYREMRYDEVVQWADSKGLNTETHENWREAALMLFNEKYGLK